MKTLNVVLGPKRAFDRICLDEALFRDPLKRSWLVFDRVGEVYNECSVILGISGKIPLLVHEPEARRDGVEILRRFTGGGTVVVDRNAFLISIISNASDLISNNDGGNKIKPYPRDIMQWTADSVYTQAFANSRRATNNGNSEVNLTFRENDYVLRNEAKIGGNAQAISGDRFCHHTSFLWRVDAKSMSYLKHPDKAPEYRAGRAHLNFLHGLEHEIESKDEFYSQVLLQFQLALGAEVVKYDAELPNLVIPSRNRVL